MMRVKEMRVEGRPREKIGKLCVKEPEREKSRGGGGATWRRRAKTQTPLAGNGKVE